VRLFRAARLASDSVRRACPCGDVALRRRVNHDVRCEPPAPCPVQRDELHACDTVAPFEHARWAHAEIEVDIRLGVHHLFDEHIRDPRLEVQPVAVEVEAGIVATRLVVGFYALAELLVQPVDAVALAHIGDGDAVGNHPAEAVGRLHQGDLDAHACSGDRRADARRRAADNQNRVARLRRQRAVGTVNALHTLRYTPVMVDRLHRQPILAPCHKPREVIRFRRAVHFGDLRAVQKHAVRAGRLAARGQPIQGDALHTARNRLYGTGNRLPNANARNRYP
jgi:hypothetical protein